MRSRLADRAGLAPSRRREHQLTTAPIRGRDDRSTQPRGALTQNVGAGHLSSRQSVMLEESSQGALRNARSQSHRSPRARHRRSNRSKLAASRTAASKAPLSVTRSVTSCSTDDFSGAMDSYKTCESVVAHALRRSVPSLSDGNAPANSRTVLRLSKDEADTSRPREVGSRFQRSETRLLDRLGETPEIKGRWNRGEKHCPELDIVRAWRGANGECEQ